jgi:hypothetical protein
MNPKRWPVIRELIGRARMVVISMRSRYPHRATRDLTIHNYAFYDAARRGLARGLEISGLLLKTIGSKTASWVLGRPPSWKMENPRNQEALTDWGNQNHNKILWTYEEAVNLGDYYLVVNADLTLTAVPPDVVEPIVADDDYSKTIGWRITQRFQHPTEIGKWMVEINEYTNTQRIRRVQFDNTDWREERYTNLIGMCPVIHIANNRHSNEVFGTPEGAALVAKENSLLHRYGEILDAGLNGNILQGRPTPTAKFNDAQSVEQYFQKYGKTETDPETHETTTYVEFDADKLMAIAGEFKYAQPGSFAGDTEKLLGILYWLVLEYTEIPEFVMGTAVTSSKASTETQMPIFVKWIQKKQGQVEDWVIQLAQVVNALQALTMPGVTLEKPVLAWPELTDTDGQLLLEVVQWAYAEALMDGEKALELLMVIVPEIENPKEVLAAAKAERRNPAEQRDKDFTGAIRDNRNANDGDEDDDDIEEIKAAA